MAVLASLLACSRTPSAEVASFKLGGGVNLIVSMTAMHPFLAEFERAAWLSKPGKTPVPQALTPDTGGYSVTSVYRFDQSTPIPVGKLDRWSIDTLSEVFTRGACQEPAPFYLGAFDWDNTHPWRFFRASLHSDSFANAASDGNESICPATPAP